MGSHAVEVVRRWYDRLMAGDPGVELCHPEIEIRNWEEMPTPGPYHGHDGVRRWWSDVTDDDIGDLRVFDVDEIADAGEDRVVVVQRITGRARHTGLDLGGAWGCVITVRDGLIASAIGYAHPRDAKRAAGLEG